MTSKANPQCMIARRAVDLLRSRGERMVIVPQNLYEFWSVATRKPGGQLGRQPERLRNDALIKRVSGCTFSGDVSRFFQIAMIWLSCGRNLSIDSEFSRR